MGHDGRAIQRIEPGEDLLALVRSKSPEARERLLAAPLDQLAEGATALAPRARAEFLERCERGPEIVPHLPEAVFTSAVISTGIEHAGWLLESATPEQRVAAIDLDCWKSSHPVPERFFEWVDGLIEAGPQTLARAFEELDLELWILLFKRMARFRFLPRDEIAEVPTLDGMIGIEAQSSEDEERVRQILRTALSESPEHYWQFLIGAMEESQVECAEEAATKQRGRLLELGFPERAQAMGVYRPLELDEIPRLATEPGARGTRTDPASVPALLDGTLLGAALTALEPERATQLFQDMLIVANSLAVADELPLSEPESVAQSLEKAVRGIERGIAAVAERDGCSPATVLTSVDPFRLFRAGATLEGSLRPMKTLAELEREENADDWAVPTETISEHDQTLGEDGSLR